MGLCAFISLPAFPIIHLSHLVITSGLPHHFDSLKLEEKEGGGDV